MDIKPKFIVLEGIDGSGKTTQIKLLQMALTEMGIVSSISAEPTGLEGGVKIRRVLSGELKTDTLSLAKMFASDRASHNTDPEWGIEKCLSDGITVISDRYYYSSMAYQGAELGLDKVYELNLGNPSIRRPDLCIFLDLTPEKSLERIQNNRESKEIFENYETLQRTREKFYEVFEYMREKGDRIVTIDASGTVDSVSQKIISAVKEIF